MESRTTFFGASAQQPAVANNPEHHAWLREIKRDATMNAQEFDARMIAEHRMMLALMRVGACVLAADQVLQQRFDDAAEAEKKQIKKECKSLRKNYSEKIKYVLEYASPDEFMLVAENLSAMLISTYGFKDPAPEQEKIFMKYFTFDPEGEKKLGYFYGQQSWKLLHGESDEITSLLTYLVGANAWLSIKVLLLNIPAENRDFAIRASASRCKDAIQTGSVEVVKMLLTLGVDPKANVSYPLFFGGSQSVCLLVHLIAHVRSFARSLDELSAHDGRLIDGEHLQFKLANVQEVINQSINKLHIMTEELLRAGADVEQDEPGSGYSYETAWIGRMFPSVPDPEHLPRGMAAKTLRKDIEENDKLNAEQKQLLGDVLRLIIHARKLEPVLGGETALKKPKH